jgi:hypothetical protein
MSYNIMIDYDIYDHFTMEHFRLRQSMILNDQFFFACDSTYDTSINMAVTYIMYVCC